MILCGPAGFCTQVMSRDREALELRKKSIPGQQQQQQKKTLLDDDASCNPPPPRGDGFCTQIKIYSLYNLNISYLCIFTL